MKEYLKYNFQYLLVAIFWTIFSCYHLVHTDRMGCVIGGLIASTLSIGWSLFRHHELFSYK